MHCGPRESSQAAEKFLLPLGEGWCEGLAADKDRKPNFLFWLSLSKPSPLTSPKGRGNLETRTLTGTKFNLATNLKTSEDQQNLNERLRSLKIDRAPTGPPSVQNRAPKKLLLALSVLI